MAYCTLDDILKKIPEATVIQLTDDEGASLVNTSRVDEAIEGADAEIDGYCATRYTVPLDPVLPIIIKLACDLAIYNLYARVVENIPDTRQKQRDAAIKLLERIADGKVLLGGPATEPVAAVLGRPAITSADRMFNRNNLVGF